jgi:hypothetical protein
MFIFHYYLVICRFAVVASIAGAGYNVNAVIIMGVAGLLAVRTSPALLRSRFSLSLNHF